MAVADVAAVAMAVNGHGRVRAVAHVVVPCVTTRWRPHAQACFLVPGQTRLSSVAQQAHAALACLFDADADADAHASSPSTDLVPSTSDSATDVSSLYRLRKYDPLTARRLDTFTGRDEESIGEVVAATTAVLLLERRASTRVAWTEYDPNEMMVRVARWDSTACAPAEGAGMAAMVRVPHGQSDGTVGDLRVRWCHPYGMPIVCKTYWQLGLARARVCFVSVFRRVFVCFFCGFDLTVRAVTRGCGCADGCSGCTGSAARDAAPHRSEQQAGTGAGWGRQEAGCRLPRVARG